jgi:hypothetical protein
MQIGEIGIIIKWIKPRMVASSALASRSSRNFENVTALLAGGSVCKRVG